MKRYLYAWFPDWPLERLRRARQISAQTSSRPDRPPRPFVLVEGGRHGLVVAAANRPAQALGLQVGLAFTDACARAPDLASAPIDRAADQSALRKLADWMVRFSPLVSLDGPGGGPEGAHDDALLLESTGCDHLFAGEAAMARDLAARLAANGYSARLAIAATPGAARALAHAAAQAGSPVVLAAGEERAGLCDLPVEALRLSEETARLLRRFGLTRIGQLYGLDRKALARRFASRRAADAVVLRLDQALGLRPEPMTPLRPAPDWSARLPCPEPVASSEGVDYALGELARDLCAQLDDHGAGARDFSFYAFRADGGASAIHVSAARPVRAPDHVARLFKEHVARIDPGFGIDLFMLAGARAEVMGREAAPLGPDFTAVEIDAEALARLADRLTARLGAGAVRAPRFHESHVPERAERLAAFAGEAPACLPPAPAGPRPLRLLDPPEPIMVLAQIPDGPPVRFVWRRVTRRIARADGPERIAPEWWRLSEKGARARDYYRVEDEAGRRYWIYRHGLYEDGRGGPPQWFLHGLFG